MSTYTESLLRKYNKHLQPTAKTETDDENKKKFVTPSYVNTYDALYDAYSKDPNFNMNMWQNAIQLGEQDRYIALLDGNKDKQLSAQFYDPEYYDYEAMMLELSLPYADNEKKAMRYQDVFNNVSGEWEEVEIGEMTDNEYYRHLLNENRTTQSEQITKSLEQWHKEQLTTMQKFWSGVGATAGELGEGLLTGLTGIIDLVVSPFAASGMAWSDGVGGQNWLDAFVDYFGEHSLTALEKKTVRAALDEYERLNTTFRDIDGNLTTLGKYCTGIANSIGMMIPAIIANLATGGAASLAWVGTAAFSASIFSGNMYENATNKERVDSPSLVKITNAAVKTGAEALIEYTLGKFLGGTIQNQAIGLTGTFSKLGTGLGKGAGIKYLFKSAGQEGLEEFLQDFSTNCIDQFYNIWNEGYGNNGVTFQTLVDSFILGSLSSIFMSGFSAYVSQPIMSGIDKKRGKLAQWDVVELEPGKTTKLKGLTRMAYGDMVSNFQKAIEELKSGKLSMRKNLKLAQQVNAGLSVISQFYSSLSEERIKSCELLLGRIVKADQRRIQREQEYYIGTKAQIKTDRDIYSKKVTKATTEFGQHVENMFNISVLTASVIHKKNEAEKVAKAADKVDETLKEGNVTKSEFVADKDGNVYGQDEKGRKFEEVFGKKAQDTFEKLRKEFDWAFITDGYTAADADDCLFVPGAWLQNYEASEIYKFLEQTHVLDRLVEMTKKGSKLYDLKFAQMVNRLVDIDAKLTKQKNLTKKSALMDLLFNEHVYQYFLLSQRDKYFDDIKGFIFTLHDTVNGMIEESKYYQQKRKGALMQTRVTMRKKIYDDIRKTMKGPTMKAIINWRIPPQDVGADSVFGPNSAELKFINAYKAREKILHGGPKGPNKQAFMNLKEELLNDTYDRYTDIIENGFKDDASIDERTTAVGILDIVDYSSLNDTSDALSMARAALDTSVERLQRVLDNNLDAIQSEQHNIVEKLIKDIDWYTEDALSNTSYTDSRNLGTEAGLVAQTVERIRETFDGYEQDHNLSYNDDIIFLLDNIGDDGHLDTLAEDVEELSRLLRESLDVESPIATELRRIVSDIGGNLRNLTSHRDVSDELYAQIKNWTEESSIDGILNIGVEDLKNIVTAGINLLEKCRVEFLLKHSTRQKKLGFGMLQIPHQVMNLVENGDAAGAQFVTDRLYEFEKTYGIPARQMLMGDLVGMSLDQRNQLTRDMELLKVDTLHMFVLRKLEHMLGDDYMVTLAANQTSTDDDFSVTKFDDKIFDADYDKLYNRLDSLNAERIAWFDKVHRVISNLKSEEKANDYIEEFLDILSALDSPYSDFKEYVPSDLSIFSKELNKKFLTTNIDVLNWLMANKGRIENIFETMRQNIDDVKAGYSSSNKAEKLSLELDNVRALVKKIKNALQRSKQKSSDALFNWLTEFYKTANLLFSTAEEYKPLLKDYQHNWIKSLSLQISKSGSDRKALETIVAKANDIYDFYEELLSQMPIESSQSSQEQIGEPAPDKFTDFVITKAISSEVVLPKEVFDMTIEEQNDMLYNLLTGMAEKYKLDNENTIRKHLDDAAKNYELLEGIRKEEGFEHINDAIEYLQEICVTEDFALNLHDAYYNRGYIVDPLTGEVLYENGVIESSVGEFLFFLVRSLYGPQPVILTDILDLSMFPELEERAKLCTVRYEERYDENGHYNPALNEIVIAAAGHMRGFIHTLIHEFKHFLQNEYNLPGGFNTDTAENMPDFLLDVANHHRDYVNYVYYERGLPPLPDGEITDETFRKYPPRERERREEFLAYAAYMLVQGEIQSRAYIHNPKQTHGYVEYIGKNGQLYLLSPDGKRKFRVVHGKSSTSQSAIDEQVADFKKRLNIVKSYDKKNMRVIGAESLLRDLTRWLFDAQFEFDFALPPELEAGSFNINRQQKMGKNGAVYQGEVFWSGSVDLRDGVIEEIHSYEEAARHNFIHSSYFSPEQLDKMMDGNAAFFWIDNGRVMGDWRDSIPQNIIHKIEEQIELSRVSDDVLFTALLDDIDFCFKTIDKIRRNGDKSTSQSASPKVTPVLAEAAVETKLEKGVLRLFALKQNQEKEGVTDRYSKTYHSALTKQASSSLVAQIVDPSLPFFDRMQLRLDDIITNPDYLSPEIKEMCNGDLSEGNVYYRTKEWVEKNIPGISIDRDFRHKYIWVDDNAFDDLLVTSLKAQTTSDDVSLVDKYNEAGRIPLSKFYNSKQLQEFGIPSDTYVIVAPEVNTETAFTEDALNGAIFINSMVVKDDKAVPLTDAEFINRLNHEFRHLLQSYNGFETGFTPSFKVTPEMLADMKKHYGAVFKNDDIIFWAKKAFGNKWQEGIAQRIVYFLVGGEQNAYGYLASDLNTKPAYVDYELGKPTIFMPHYNAETGEGKYTTEFIAMRAEDETDVPKKSSGKKAEKEKKETVKIPRIDEQIKQKKKERSEEKRYFSNAKAKGTNLEYFIKPGKDNQLPERLQDFVIATTGNEDKLPPEIMDLISGQYKGTLTTGALMQWFRKADDINDFTFDLLNKYIFKNDYIDSLEDLNKFLDTDPAFCWAAAQIFAQTDISYQYLVEADTSVDEFKERLKTIENYEKFKSSIEKKMADFETGVVDAGTRSYGTKLSTHPQVQKYMRVLAMTYFDGTLASAFYIANYFKLVMRLWEGELITSMTSLDSTVSDKEGNTTSFANKLHAGMVEGEKNTGYGNDITALYLANHTFDEDFDVMIHALVAARFVRLAAEKGVKISSDDITRASIMRKEHPELEEVLVAAKKYLVELNRKDPDAVAQLYHKMKFAELVGVEEAKKDIIVDTSTNELAKISRRTIVARIKSKAKSLLDRIEQGLYDMSSLPEDIQAMFEKQTFTSKTGKKTKRWALKPEIYSVGRGKVKLKGQVGGGLLYETQHNIYEGTEVFRHDTSKLVKNFEKLSIALKTAQNDVAEARREKKNAKRRHARHQAAGSKTAEFIKEGLKEQKRKKSKTSITPETEGTYTTEFKVGKNKRHLTDTPNNFTIVSPIEMPEVLRKIFDVSFDKFATTEVQFISTDKDGNYYVKKNFKKGEFEGDTVHEVNTLQTFYEANAQTLLNLTRTDVLSIIDFIRHGSVTFDGPSNKYGAFQVFLLAYIIDAARRNSNDWNMSETEVQNIEKLASNVFSTTGSTMNAISQVQDLINPYRVVKQAMFNDWDAISQKDKDDFIELTEQFEKEHRAEEQVKYAERLQQMLNEFGKRQAAADNKKKYPRWTRSWLNHWYDKAKSYRYLAMLSSPATWLRNVVSNSLVTGLNKTADVISKFVFENVKGNSYRKDQWDLAGTVVSEEVKQFIDTYVKKNPIFNPDLKDEITGEKNKDAINIYNISGKYDPRQNKEAKDGRSLFVSVIARAYERKYAVEHRFDTKFMNKLSKIIDTMMTDEKFIKFATNRYFGKILTIEAKNGKVDLSKGFKSETMDLFAEAIILANIDYMHKRNFLSDLFDDMRNEHPAMYEALTLWQPFLNSSFNWFAEAFKYTPIGLINSIRRACKLEEQIQKIDEKRKKGELVASSRAVEYLIRRDVGKGIVGALLSALGMLLASFGVIRIDEEDDKFYVCTGNIKFDISNLFASSSLLIGASIAQAWTSEENGFENVMSRLTDTMLDGFFAVDILDRHRWGGSWEDILSETESVMKSFTPQIIQFLTSLFVKRKIRYSSGLKGIWERYINGWTGGAMGNSVINVYTGEREDKYALPILEPALAKGLLGPKIYWVDISENERFAREYGVNKAELTGELTVNGSKVTLDRYALNKKYGELNNQSLPKIKSQKHEVKMPDGTYETLSWDDMSKDQRGDVIDRTMSRNADLAKIYMWTSVMSKKYYASDAVYKRLKDAGITQNVYRGDKGFVE